MVLNLFDELMAITRKLQAGGVDYTLCGGLAMAAHAFPRATLDIDLLVLPEHLEQAKNIVRSLGYTFEGGILEFHDGDVVIHRLTKTFGPDFLSIDFLVVGKALRNAWNSRLRIETEFGELVVVSAQGLIEMKSMRSSGQDRDDIEYLRGLDDEG